MADTMKGLKRTHYCGTVTPEMIGREVVVCGWAQKTRDMGTLVFIDLRDRTGIVQLAFDDKTDPALLAKAQKVRAEYVLMARGVLRQRESVNHEIPTGEVEVYVTELRVLAESNTPPFAISDDSRGVKEDLRLKYRYLDLRRPEMQNAIAMRHRIVKIARDYYDTNGFYEIETPILIKSTPEGARDYLVPSRVQQGKFYALPQSPQLYKQILMCSGFDRYMQIARCFRDEDLRADRQPEFTQIDLEMSFVEMEDVLAVGEGFMKTVFKELLDTDISLPLPRLTYKEAMERFGSDKPDIRYGMEIFDLTDLVKDSAFSVFSGACAAGGTVRAIKAENAVSVLTRKEIDKLTEYVKGIGGKGLAWIRYTPDGVASSFAKFMTEEEMNAIAARADAKTGDVVMIIADTNTGKVLSQLGSLRIKTADKLNIEKKGIGLLWITEFPFFEYDEEAGEWVAMHHPFTAPLDECLEYLETDKSKVRAKAYDLVLNGIELSSGSIRITNPELQSRIFDLLGLTKEEAKEKFGYLLDAFKYGAPPHGGMGIGLDRLTMQLLGCDSLRDVIAYPKVQNASELMTMCPAPVDKKALDDLGLDVKVKENEDK